MVVCPNCGKGLRDNFSYCRICGSDLKGNELGDYSTGMLNVFKHEEEYLYLFSEKGNQVVVKAGSMEELADIVCEKQYPWEFNDWKNNVKHDKKETVEIPEFKTEFLKASALKGPEIIPTASTKKKKEEYESYVPEYVVEKVEE